MKRVFSQRDETGDEKADVLARQRLLANQLSWSPKAQPESKNNNPIVPVASRSSPTATDAANGGNVKDLAQKAVATARARMGLSKQEQVQIQQPNKASQEEPQLQKPRSHARPTAMKRTLLATLAKTAGAAGVAGRSDDGEFRYPTVEVEDFWRNLRSWDFCQDLQLYIQQQLPLAKNDASSPSAQQQQTPLPESYNSYSHYVSAWAPLCLKEARAQLLADIVSGLQQQQQQKKDLFHISVSVEPLRMDIGSHTDYVRLLFQLQEEKQPQPLQQRQNPLNGSNTLSFKPNDLVLLVRESYQLSEILSTSSQNQKGNLSSNQNTAASKLMGLIGTCENFKSGTPEGLIVKVSRKLWKIFSCKESSSSDNSQNQQNQTLYLVPLKAKNITSLREFQALCRVKDIPLLPILLAGNPEVASSTSGDNSNKKKTKTELLEEMGGVNALGKGFAAYAERKFNESQLEAISAASKDYGKGGFTLVKGPPGTGKTTTLVALVNALHIKQFNKYYEELRRQATGDSCSEATTFQELSKNKPRILICAPSNAAVDNIILKIMEDGFIDGNGCRYNPVICRIGIGQSTAVGDVSLETKVMNTLEEGNDVSNIQQIAKACREEMYVVRSTIKVFQRRANAILSASPWPLAHHYEIRIKEPFEQTNQVYFVNHRDKTTSSELPPPPEPNQVQFPPSAMPEYRSYVSKLVKEIERYNNLKNAKATLRQRIETHILDSVHIVLTTLGTAGSRALEAAAKFEVVVVDEAAQSVEPATLPALQLGSSHAILVGDPQQLPATIFSVSGKTTKYDRSLFQRLEEAGHKVHMLNVQYRMHPDISDFPRRIFYGGNLLDGPNVLAPDYGNPLRLAVTTAFKTFRPFTILDVESSEEREQGGTSLSNSTESNLALHLYKSLYNDVLGAVSKAKVAVISPYSQQVNLLRRTFSAALGEGYEDRVEINTVDGFQGRESNIVIFSCVRAAGSKGIGFLSDVRRMNVALTRAKYFLFVIARCKSIVVNPYWRDLVKHAREKGSVVPIPMKKGKGPSSLPSLTKLRK